MKKGTKILLGVISIVVIVILVTLKLIDNLFSGMCGNEIVRSLNSTNNKYKVVIFKRDCGATTGFSSQVSILNSNEELRNESGNLFISDCDHGKAPRAAWGGPEIKMKWLNKDTLELAYHKDARIFLQKYSYKEIFIKYEVINKSL